MTEGYRRGAGEKVLPVTRERVGLPVRPFLFTLDQIATLLNVELKNLKSTKIFFEGRSTGATSVHLMIARNIAAPNETPDWRVAERELVRWMKLKRFRVYEVGVVTS